MSSNGTSGPCCNDKRACIDWSGHLAGGRQSGNYPETGCEESVPHSDILESWIVHSIVAP